MGPETLVIVQPSMRRRSNKTLWVHRWNQLHQSPFKFYQTCSCQTGNAVPGCHLTCYVGASKSITLSPCSEIPTLSATPEASVVSLGGTLNYLSASLLSGCSVSGLVPVALPAPTQALCRLAPEGVGPQQTPDSAQMHTTTQGGSLMAESLNGEANNKPAVGGSLRAESQQAYPTYAKERNNEEHKRKNKASKI